MKACIPVLFLLTVILLAAACGGEESKPAEISAAMTPMADTVLCPTSPQDTIPFDDALVFIEFNSTDEDLGFHATFDSPGWEGAAICSPEGIKLFEVKAGGSTEKHGLSELFFEGAEPSLDEQPKEEFLARFPEGEYIVAGVTTQGQALRSEATFTHDIPDEPVLISPDEGETVPLDSVVIAWEPVTSPPGIEVVRYEVFFATAEPPEGEPAPTLDIELMLQLPSTVSEVQIPPEFLMPGTGYQVEVLAIEFSGNKTIAALDFQTGSEKARNGGDTAPLKAAKLIIEHNATDEDTGFQGFVDSGGWEHLAFTGPEGAVLAINGQGKLGRLGLTALT